VAHYDLYRRDPGAGQFKKLNLQPLRRASYADSNVEPGRRYAYRVVALSRRGEPSMPSAIVEATPAPRIQEPVFTAFIQDAPAARLRDGSLVSGRLAGGAKVSGGVLQTGVRGMASFEHQAEFDLGAGFSMEGWVLIEKQNQMPVVLSCGAYNGRGWFLQSYGARWRWHLAGVSCDGGRPVEGRWTHLAATFDGRRASLYQDGQLVKTIDCDPDRTAWPGPLVIGQYSHQAPPYQVEGKLAGVRLYRRALRPEEAASAFRAGPPK
jgi:hypothetical protein